MSLPMKGRGPSRRPVDARRRRLGAGLAMGLALAPWPLMAAPPEGAPPAGDAAGNALVKGLQARLRQPEWLHGQFEQSKQVQGFRKPLVSRGEFVVARGRGILWRTLTPFASELRLTPNDMRASQGGTTTLQMDAQREPALRLINEMMFALIGGDVAALGRLFEISGELRGRDAWRLVLRPRQAAWRQVLLGVTLEGDSLVRQAELEEASGDRTRIVFTRVREGAPEGAAGL